MAKSTSPPPRQRDEDDQRQQRERELRAHQRLGDPAPRPPDAAAPEAAPMVSAAAPTVSGAAPARHPVLEQIFGRAPIEAVPEGRPLPPPRRPLQTAPEEPPEYQPLTPPAVRPLAEVLAPLLPLGRP